MWHLSRVSLIIKELNLSSLILKVLSQLGSVQVQQSRKQEYHVSPLVHDPAPAFIAANFAWKNMLGFLCCSLVES